MNEEDTQYVYHHHHHFIRNFSSAQPIPDVDFLRSRSENVSKKAGSCNVQEHGIVYFDFCMYIHSLNLTFAWRASQKGRKNTNEHTKKRMKPAYFIFSKKKTLLDRRALGTEDVRVSKSKAISFIPIFYFVSFSSSFTNTCTAWDEGQQEKVKRRLTMTNKRSQVKSQPGFRTNEWRVH